METKHDKILKHINCTLWGWALIRVWALINFYLQGGCLFEVGAYSRLSAGKLLFVKLCKLLFVKLSSSVRIIMKITKLRNGPEFSYHCSAHFLLMPRPLSSMNAITVTMLMSSSCSPALNKFFWTSVLKFLSIHLVQT